MKVVLLAGGMGSRLSEVTDARPKPMIEIGGKPILWHIMRRYASYGFEHFVVALGYKAEMIQRWACMLRDFPPSMRVELHGERGDVEPLGTRGSETAVETSAGRDRWTLDLVDTGLHTMTGGRLRRLRPYLEDQTFMLSYGDGVADVDIPALLEAHRKSGRLATLTAVRPPARFGELALKAEESGTDRVLDFSEKPQTSSGWINGGFMVFEPAVLTRIESDQSILERDVLEGLAEEGQLGAYCHHGFWACMDTLRDHRMLEDLCAKGTPPWEK